MTIFKTKEQIEDMARDYAQECRDNLHSVGGVSEAYLIADYLKGYTQAQQDIKEACSKSFNDWLWGVNFGGTTQDEISRMKFAWEMAKFSSMKELQEKDAEIAELKRALQLIYDNSRANYIDKQEKEKFRQVVEKYKLHKY